jgi:hypothetical protein
MCSSYANVLQPQFSLSSNIQCTYPQNIFSTCLLTNDSSISRYISIAVFALCIIILLVLSSVFVWQSLFKNNQTLNGVASVFIGIFVAITTYLSLQISAFNLPGNYIYIILLFFILITVFLVFTIILFNQTSEKYQRYARGAASTSLFAEFIFLIILLGAPNFAAGDGVVTQSILFTPIIALTAAATASSYM